MKKDIFLLGSTGSIGETTLKVIKKDKLNFNVKLLSTNKNVKKIYKQAVQFNVKKVVIFDKKSYQNNLKKFKDKKIRVFLTIKEALRKNKRKSFLSINGISGIEGLEPTLEIIKYSNNLAMANKESIICGWQFITKELTKCKTGFIPLDSEHFSIWSLMKDESKQNIKKIYLTASGGPFLNKDLKKIKNIKPKFALNHPNWKMGKKISIDSATMMNKIFEIIEAIKIFNIERNKFDILIHPKSYLHAIVNFKNGLTKLLAHETTMEIPIANSLYVSENNFIYKRSNFDYHKLNSLNFEKPNIKNYPLLKILNYEFKNTYFEIILVSINDMLVKNYLANKISYISIHDKMLELLKKRYFTKYYSSSPNNIKDIKTMVEVVNRYIIKYLKVND